MTEDLPTLSDDFDTAVDPEEVKAVDPGEHYRYSYHGVNIDPYRICRIYDLGGGPREHMTKKLLRGSGKGHEELELINELQCCLDRWREMYEEDNA